MPDINPSSSYRYLRTTGPITVERTDHLITTPDWPNIVLILGPTGAGKSTFIEALANDSSLQISSNRLEGCTQSISMYQLKNTLWGVDGTGGIPIYLVDVPGFADTKISAMSIVSMLKDWMTKMSVRAFSYTLYLTPINVPRVPGSHRQVLRTFQGLTGIEVAEAVTVVSTMWDTISSESGRMRAERNFSQLREDIWKEYLDSKSRLVKFTNTQESALSVLDAAFVGNITTSYLHVEDFINDSLPIQQTPFASHLIEDLNNRITNLRIQCSNIQIDMQEASGRSDEDLMNVLCLQLEEAERHLAKFEREMQELVPVSPDTVASVPHAPGTIPSLTIPASLTQPTPITTTGVPTGRPDVSSIRPVHSDLPRTSAAEPIETETLPEVTSKAGSNAPGPTVAVHTGQSTLAAPSNKGHLFVQVIQMMKCWGKDVARRHDN